MPDLLTIFLFIFSFLMLALWWRSEKARREIEQETVRLKGITKELESQSEQVQVAEQARQAALFDSMTEGVLLLDKDAKVLLVNQTLETTFGVKDDIRGVSIMEAFRFHELKELVDRLLIDKKLEGAELELPGLEKRVLSANASVVLDNKGDSQGMILVFHELTRIKELENTRQEFVANVSHELRTPLSMIKGYVETLVDGANNDPDVAGKFLGTIQKHTDRLAFLIEDLLTISRLESGQVLLNPEVIDVGMMASKIADELNVKSAKRNVTIVSKIDDGILVRADRERLQQVMINLLDNAIKYGKEGGEVVIDAETQPGDRVRVGIHDDGPGIPPDAQERIFERFYRVDRARSREQGGTGLGLSIVKHIIQSHGGDVWVESKMGEGTSFYFELPV